MEHVDPPDLRAEATDLELQPERRLVEHRHRQALDDDVALLDAGLVLARHLRLERQDEDRVGEGIHRGAEVDLDLAQVESVVDRRVLREDRAVVGSIKAVADHGHRRVERVR